MKSLAETYDVALLDLDGVIYVGTRAVPHAAVTLAEGQRLGMRLAFVTNNASRPPEAVAQHLTSLGVPAAPEEVVTSSQAAARMLAEMLRPGSRVLVVGGAGLVEALEEQRLVPVFNLADQPAAVVQGFHPDVDWRMLAEGSYAVATGVPWVASNVDVTVPTSQGRAPGNGALVEVVRLATGATPQVAGKPEAPMHREAVLRTGARTPLVVGDRLDTDIEGAYREGADSLLVLTGVTDPERLATAAVQHRPTYVAEDLRALLDPPSDAAVNPGLTRYGTWTTSLSEGRVVVEPVEGVEPRRIDALRAVCGLCWAADEQPAGIGEALRKAGW